MSFSFLLMILSLVVIVPVVFVVRKNASTQQLTSNQQHQHYLTNQAKKTLHDSRPDLKISDTLVYYRNNPKLPISFRQILGKINEHYLALSATELAPDQRFTVDKLIGTRLPEIMEDYLSLDNEYATNEIIDKAKGLTSQDVTYGQLVSMLEFMQRMSDSGQSQVASNILANRSYLQSVYGEFYEPDSEAQAIKAPELDELSEDALSSEETLYELGETYLADCDQLSSKGLALTEYKEVIGEPIVTQLGELVYLAERVLTYSEALLTDSVSLQGFDKIISQSIPNLLRKSLEQALAKQATSETDNDSELAVKLSSDQQSLIEHKISRVNQLLEDCAKKLEQVSQKQYAGEPLSNNALNDLRNTINSKHSQAEYLLNSGFFNQ